MLKLEAVEQDELRFSVDPRLVQPQIVQPTLEDLLIERDTETHFCRSPEDVLCLPTVDGNVRMEHCINLDLYLAPISDKMDNFYADELNTPETFEATKELNKIINATTHLKQSYGNPFNFPAATQPMVTSSAAIAIERIRETTSKLRSAPATTFSFDTDSHLQNQHQMVDEMMEDDAVDHGGLLSPDHFDISDEINLSEYDLLTDWQDAIINDMNSDNVVTEREADADFAPQSMVSSVNATAINEHHNYALKLDINQLLPNEGDALQTPDIINTILYYEHPEGMQGQFVTPDQVKEEMTVYNEESQTSTQPDLFFNIEPQSSPEKFKPHEDDSSMQSAASSVVVPVKGKRLRRRKQDSDDEDYVPPSQTPRRTVKRRTIKVEDTDDEDYTPAKIPKRGRPSKAASVVSARSSESSECSKYREMRDKNNEASRRSRRKRRIQERGIEDECETLEMTNIRLRAQVTELEKSVTLYRENVMNMLLKKA